jgi:small subunit ribosomal protein S11
MTIDKKISSKKGVAKTKKVKKVPEGEGIIHGFFSFNNSILRLTKKNGDALGKTISPGSIGFKNTKKSTPYAAQKAAEEIIQRASEYGINSVVLEVKGIGAGRDPAIKKILEANSLKVKELVESTPVPYNGTRPRKKPRK